MQTANVSSVSPMGAKKSELLLDSVYNQTGQSNGSGSV
ncbi:hypothetical protein SAMN05421644_1335 [Allochromatium warmingii]|uniref:Uncharacterized protein n=1 Tax=Allochromatium warmingii TaxID=61595 RepID=A0A1H3HGB2_ALLWA|nr:hypothetical protein SAMN05421644_1335 [Allochromatium warmingii]